VPESGGKKKSARVVDLMAALRESLEEVKTRRPPARAPARMTRMTSKSARVLSHAPRSRRRKAG